jgi:hypothetical protein
MQDSTSASHARELAHRTCAQVSRIAPAGLAAWLPRLPAIATADTDATLALIALEDCTDGYAASRLRSQAESACTRLVSEWRRAAKRWEAKGRPVPV